EFEKKTKGLNIKCEDKIKNLREKIITLRHKVIAHLNKEQCKRGIDKFISEHKIDISDLEILRNAIVKVFDYICFRHKRGTLPLDYSDTIYSNTDIDRIFDALVKDSNVFKMPEDQPDYWPYHRENMSKNDIRIFNEYRIKFGRSPV
ncbi:hypothetical protein KJ656_00790, partial [bacterium]|nr:hypothetical protein [bacterium]